MRRGWSPSSAAEQHSHEQNVTIFSRRFDDATYKRSIEQACDMHGEIEGDGVSRSEVAVTASGSHVT